MIKAKRRVAIVEDDDRLRDQIAQILSSTKDIELSISVSSAEEALEKIPAYRPDVVLMDIKLPKKSGIQCIYELRQQSPNSEVLILTALEDEESIFEALREGASGYLLKTSTTEQILDAIRDVMGEGAPFSSSVARKVALFFRQERRVREENQSLSPREREVLQLLSSGYIYKEVADQLGITIETVRTYMKRICAKLHVRSKVEAIIKFRK